MKNYVNVIINFIYIIMFIEYINLTIFCLD